MKFHDGIFRFYLLSGCFTLKTDIKPVCHKSSLTACFAFFAFGTEEAMARLSILRCNLFIFIIYLMYSLISCLADSSTSVKLHSSESRNFQVGFLLSAVMKTSIGNNVAT